MITTNVQNSVESVNRLANLFAAEDLTVEHVAGLRTAEFNLKSRTVKLPIWDCPPEVQDLLTAHECAGHAIETPMEEWRAALEDQKKAFKSFLNITEDARIEKLVKRRFPGMRRTFNIGYRWMLDNDFFGKSIEARLPAMKLIDRLNVAAKVGSNLVIEFDGVEKVFWDRLMALETFDEANQLAIDLFEYQKSEDKPKKNDNTEQGDGEGTDEEYGETDDEQYGDDDGGEEESSDEEDDTDAIEEDGADTTDADDLPAQEDDTDANEEDDAGAGDADEEDDDDAVETPDPVADTDDAFSDAMSNLVDDQARGTTSYVNVPEIDLSKLIVGYKTSLELLEEDINAFDPDLFLHGATSHAIWRTNNNKAIAWMVKEFEMKKAADMQARTRSSKTGLIDPLKLHSYQYNDDIFARGEVVAEGKNHGLQMFVDWSGSMRNNLFGTIQQVLNLVNFCRRVNIPFNVYAFTDDPGMCAATGDTVMKQEFHTNIAQVIPGEWKENDFAIDAHFRLVELFSSDMGGNEIRRMSEMLLGISDVGNYMRLSRFSLHATPLNDAILAAVPVVEKFKSSKNVQIVNAVFLTDGDSNNGAIFSGNPDENTCNHTYLHTSNAVLRDMKTRKTMPFERGEDTITFLKYFRETTGSNLMGFFIAEDRRNSFIRSYVTRKGYQYVVPTAETSIARTKFRQLQREKMLIEVDFGGYTELYFLPGGKQLEAGNSDMQGVTSESSKAQIRDAFMKSTKGLKEKRIMLTRFVEKIV